ncbi:MAG: hypothetical protein CMB99_09075 [Flavobacteriaceae bacterium]|nr:hypothetical protein [Flavobacteriaceae bacterium]|tara:strand:+ start:524569 stop:525231 length:663 start_codon:yes stop_codon:yes gene_type:complete
MAIELTKEQIQKIEDFLDLKGFHYIDLRFEILDHMISDIEERMRNNVSYESALAMTKIRWEKHLRKKNSFYFGIQNYDFSIVLNKAIKLFRPFFFLYMSLYIIPMVTLNYFKLVIPEEIVTMSNQILQILAVFATLYIVWTAVKLSRKQLKTTYSFIMKTQNWPAVILILISSFFGGIIETSGELNPGFTGFYAAGMTAAISVHYFFGKHRKSLDKLKYF